MKIYLLYVETSEDEFKRLRNRIVINPKFTKYIGDEVRFLYGWTTKQKVLNAFIDFRKNTKYLLKETKVNEQMLDAFKFDNSPSEISLQKLKISSEHEIEIMMTKNEYSYIVDYKQEIVHDYQSKLQYIDYRIFKKPLLSILDTIQYTSNYLKMIDVYQYTDYMHTNGTYLGVLGNPLVLKNQEANEARIFIREFREFL